MTALWVLGSVAMATTTMLIAWHWWLIERRWHAERVDKQRDEALALLEPRLRLLEEALKSAEWAKLNRR